MMASNNLDVFYDYVLSLIKSAGTIIKTKSSNRNKHVEFKSSVKDLVTETDAEVENLLINSLSKKFPDHKFIGEETAALETLTDAPTWIIDPIDGTMNFVHSFPHSCISIALYINKEAEIGIVYNPHLDQLFTARKGKGALLNGNPIRVSDTKNLSKALIMTENGGLFPQQSYGQDYIEYTCWLLSNSHSVRCIGSAALDLCMVACGSADAYYQYGIKIWDYAAGELILKEAGGLVTNTNGETLQRFGQNVLAASCKELINELSPVLVKNETKFL